MHLLKKYDYISKNDNPDFLNQKEIFNKLVDERKEGIFKSSQQANYDNLVLNYKDKNKSGKTFNGYTDATSLYEKIKMI